MWRWEPFGQPRAGRGEATGKHKIRTRMAYARTQRERRSPPPRGDFVGEPTIRKKVSPPAPRPKGAPLPEQWPAKKRPPSQAQKVATIDNVTLMNELKRRGLLAPNVDVRPEGFRWSAQEDAMLEEAMHANAHLFMSRSTKSPWHAVARRMGQRSYSACRKRWCLLHPLWSSAYGCDLVSGEHGPDAGPVENFHLDSLLLANPADEHYGLMALETFTDTGTDSGEDEVVDRRRITTNKTLASYTIRGMHANKHISFAFPKRRPGKWDVQLEAEHSLNMHQQGVTRMYLEMRSDVGRELAQIASL